MGPSSDFPAVGIPHGLINIRWKGDFEAFFRQRNIAVRWGNPGSYRTFLKGKKRILDEFCLPLKLFAGQVLEIAEKTDLDVFIPMILGNGERNCFLCPLQFRLGDIMVNSGLLPRERLFSPCFEFDNHLRLRSAGTELTTHEAPVTLPEKVDSGSKPVIAVVGRSYVLEDPFLNQGIPGLLEGMGFEVVFCSGKSFGGEVRALHEYSHFALTAGLLREAEDLFRRMAMAGAVILKPFLCGPDCDIEESLGDVMPGEGKIPFFIHVIDENRSEGGLRTRLEAFGDLVMSARRSA
jgi:predicted nucleotide-binding protein (sugar kinase/HSP70/actin superfamily)